jgi:hypothetical protein
VLSGDRYAPRDDRYGNDENHYLTNAYAPNDYATNNDAAHDDDEIYEYYEPLDRRWVWIAGVAGAVLLVAVICTVVILGGGDSGSVSATVVPPTATSQAPATTSRVPPAAGTTRPVPRASLPPETVTTVSPSPSATVTPPPPVAAAPPPAPAANTVTYSITGTRPLIDLVTVIYTDARGALQTDLNVALPWNKTVVLNPGVTLSSVTATSVTGQLNCSIVDGAGATIAAQNTNSMITTCTR